MSENEPICLTVAKRFQAFGSIAAAYPGSVQGFLRRSKKDPIVIALTPVGNT
jgi:hypothetical protein